MIPATIASRERATITSSSWDCVYLSAGVAIGAHDLMEGVFCLCFLLAANALIRAVERRFA